MEKESSNIDMISDVIKNGFEAGIKIASKHYHMINDLQQLLFEKDKIFRILGEQVFQMIDQGRIFAPAIMHTTFKAAKEVIERIAHLEEDKKRSVETTTRPTYKEKPISKKNKKVVSDKKSVEKVRANIKKTAKEVMKKSSKAKKK